VALAESVFRRAVQADAQVLVKGPRWRAGQKGTGTSSKTDSDSVSQSHAAHKGISQTKVWLRSRPSSRIRAGGARGRLAGKMRHWHPNIPPSMCSQLSRTSGSCSATGPSPAQPGHMGHSGLFVSVGEARPAQQLHQWTTQHPAGSAHSVPVMHVPATRRHEFDIPPRQELENDSWYLGDMTELARTLGFDRRKNDSVAQCKFDPALVRLNMAVSPRKT